MKAPPRPCPICGDDLDRSMPIDVCGVCFQELRTSGAVGLRTTGEFAPISPDHDEALAATSPPARARTGAAELACTWCGKPRREVKKLLASGDAHICNECVALCADVLEAELGADWR
ncbi:MAG TPA: ClpX C4-type zinc finger protein [Kofleriaceae bacterium]|nr:ClpX C4-type zinc finger protein [Kofleriaceae bacterium]